MITLVINLLGVAVGIGWFGPWVLLPMLLTHISLARVDEHGHEEQL